MWIVLAEKPQFSVVNVQTGQIADYLDLESAKESASKNSVDNPDIGFDVLDKDVKILTTYTNGESL